MELTNGKSDGNSVSSPTLIIPPPDIRAIVEKTASFVKRNGPIFEAKILEANASNIKFGFIKPDSPYYAYYRSKVEEQEAQEAGREETEQEGKQRPVLIEGGTKPETKQDGVVISLANAVQNVSDIEYSLGVLPSGLMMGGEVTGTTVKEAHISKPKQAALKQYHDRPIPTEPPAPELFSIPVTVPRPTEMEMEVIKSMAQYAAQNGPSFSEIIEQREQKNPLFGFLRESHQYFSIFDRLRQAYRAILRPNENVLKRVEHLSLSKRAILDEILSLLDWERLKAKELAQAAADNKADVQGVDWHDFVIVETIDFEDSELEKLPAPISGKDIQAELRRREAAEKAAAAIMASSVREDEEEDMDVEEGADRLETEQTIRFPTTNASIPLDRIRSGTAPTASAQKSLRPVMVQMPDGQVVSIEQVSQSIHAELLDPKYKEERARAAHKHRNVNLAPGMEIAENLSRFKDAKPSMFHESGRAKTMAANINAPSVGEANTIPLPETGGTSKQARFAPAAKGQSASPAIVAAHKATVTNVPEPDGQPPAKKARTFVEDDDDIADRPKGSSVPEDDWIKKYGDTVKVQVQVPTVSHPEWKLQGQLITLEVPLRVSVGALKNTLAELTKLPSNKQKVQTEASGVMKDIHSLAFYNVLPSAILSLGIKERGGKKK